MKTKTKPKAKPTQKRYFVGGLLLILVLIATYSLFIQLNRMLNACYKLEQEQAALLENSRRDIYYSPSYQHTLMVVSEVSLSGYPTRIRADDMKHCVSTEYSPNAPGNVFIFLGWDEDEQHFITVEKFVSSPRTVHCRPITVYSVNSTEVVLSDCATELAINMMLETCEDGSLVLIYDDSEPIRVVPQYSNFLMRELHHNDSTNLCNNASE